LEQVSRGALQGKDETEWRESILHLWHEEVEKHERQILDSKSERHYGAAERWPRYNLQKALTVHKALEIAASLQRSSERMVKGSWATEQHMQGHDGKLRGRIDAVYLSEVGVEIIDYKTGRLYEEDEEGELHLMEKYRRQLLLYAAIYHGETGHWPTRGHVMPLTGEKVSIEIDPAKASHEEERAISLLTRFNSQIALKGSHQSLAKPAETTCRYCGYRTICPALKST
jgi:RecB family exonuclease